MPTASAARRGAVKFAAQKVDARVAPVYAMDRQVKTDG